MFNRKADENTQNMLALYFDINGKIVTHSAAKPRKML